MTSKDRKTGAIWHLLGWLFLVVMFLLVGLGYKATRVDPARATNIANATNTSFALTPRTSSPTITLTLTSTPTPTLRPALVPGEIGIFFSSNGERTVFKVNEKLIAQGFSEAHVNHTGEFEDGKISNKIN